MKIWALQDCVAKISRKTTHAKIRVTSRKGQIFIRSCHSWVDLKHEYRVLIHKKSPCAYTKYYPRFNAPRLNMYYSFSVFKNLCFNAPCWVLHIFLTHHV